MNWIRYIRYIHLSGKYLDLTSQWLIFAETFSRNSYPLMELILYLIIAVEGVFSLLLCNRCICTYGYL